ncbi:hypothetical protein COLO4_04420 [Corchorus olitorius]|uniref:Uncharacterized protein n=1 Tax=Corchorus olitorius TaxID=93759 RepID=A0A1R3KU09_9ROSI|nr:hypothetical protein COLO4_04420 [Corchorus olitorius]
MEFSLRIRSGVAEKWGSGGSYHVGERGSFREGSWQR